MDEVKTDLVSAIAGLGGVVLWLVAFVAKLVRVIMDGVTILVELVDVMVGLTGLELPIEVVVGLGSITAEVVACSLELVAVWVRENGDDSVQVDAEVMVSGAMKLGSTAVAPAVPVPGTAPAVSVAG